MTMRRGQRWLPGTLLVLGVGLAGCADDTTAGGGDGGDIDGSELPDIAPLDGTSGDASEDAGDSMGLDSIGGGKDGDDSSTADTLTDSSGELDSASDGDGDSEGDDVDSDSGGIGDTDTGGESDIMDGGDSEDAETDTSLPPLAPGFTFLVDSLSILSPTLCYDIDGSPPCEPINALVDALLAAELAAAEEPLRLLGHFDALEFPNGSQSLMFGDGTCTDAGAVMVCTLDPDAPSTSEFPTVYTKSVGACGTNPPIPAPCFLTAKLATLPLEVLGIPFTFREAQVAATFDATPEPSALANGVMEGFVTVATSKTVGLAIAGVEDETTLFDLLVSVPAETLEDGTQGWTFRLGFAASGVELAAPEGAP